MIVEESDFAIPLPAFVCGHELGARDHKGEIL